MDFLGFLGSGVWYAVFFVIALSVIVAIHEYGHYIVGRWTGIHAEVFSLGFGPVLLSRRDRRGTRWQIAAIPFGGYVKFMGDADASSLRPGEVRALSAADRRRTMAGAPLWARALTVAAGPFANFLLTAVVLMAMLLWQGVTTETPVVARLAPLPQEQSLREGDVILALNGRATPDKAAFFDALRALPHAPSVRVSVRRGEAELTLDTPHPQLPVIGAVSPKSAAMDAGLMAGDVILAANGQAVPTFAELQKVIFGSNGAPVTLTVWRAGERFDLSLTPRPRDIPGENGSGFRQEWMIGVVAGMTFDMATRAPEPLELLTLPLQQMWNMAVMSLSGIYHMILGQISSCGMSGMVGIAEVMGDAAKSGPADFIAMIAVLSLGIGMMNLFPIPVLDGGHLVFCAYEAVAGRPPSARALEVLMTIGLTLLLSLMAFALWQDLTCV